MMHGMLPPAQGLYDPANEHDACGVGFVANVKGRKSHAIVRQGLQILENLTHRGAVGADPLAGDGAGILMQIPDAFLREECATLGMTLPAAGDYGVGAIFLPQQDATRDTVSPCWNPLSPRKARPCWAGARCQPKTAASARASRR